jgi:hypothetical protein
VKGTNNLRVPVDRQEHRINRLRTSIQKIADERSTALKIDFGLQQLYRNLTFELNTNAEELSFDVQHNKGNHYDQLKSFH